MAIQVACIIAVSESQDHHSIVNLVCRLDVVAIWTCNTLAFGNIFNVCFVAKHGHNESVNCILLMTLKLK